MPRTTCFFPLSKSRNNILCKAITPMGTIAVPLGEGISCLPTSFFRLSQEAPTSITAPPLARMAIRQGHSETATGSLQGTPLRSRRTANILAIRKISQVPAISRRAKTLALVAGHISRPKAQAAPSSSRVRSSGPREERSGREAPQAAALEVAAVCKWS